MRSFDFLEWEGPERGGVRELNSPHPTPFGQPVGMAIAVSIRGRRKPLTCSA